MTDDPNILATDEEGNKLTDTVVLINGASAGGGASNTGFADDDGDGVAELIESHADLKGGELRNVGNRNQAGGFAGLTDQGVLFTGQLPDLAITEVFSVADQAGRLALTDVQEGDVALQQDTDEGYMFTGGDPSVDSNWSLISSYSVPVTTVFGRTGDIQAQQSDYDAYYAVLDGDPTFNTISDTGGNQAFQGVAASGQVQLSSGSAIVDTDISASGATFNLALGIVDPNADAKISGRLFWDDSAGTYKVEIVEDGTSIGNPTVNYDVIRVR